MNFLKSLGIEFSDDESEDKKTDEISITDNYSLYPDYHYIFKFNGKNEGWIASKREAHTFLVEYATKFEKEHRDENTIVTRETSNHGDSIKIFSKSLGTWYDSSPQLIATLEIEQIGQIE